MSFTKPVIRRLGEESTGAAACAYPAEFFAALKMTALGVGLACCAAGALAAGIAPRMLILDGAIVGHELIVVGDRGTILRSTDQARTWQAAPRATPAALTALTFPGNSGTAGWAVGHDAVILGTTDAGRTWHKQFQGENLQDSFLDVLALDARHVIAVGAYAMYFETKDGGKSWTRRKITEDDYHFNRLTRGPSGTLYLAGERGTLLKSADSGTTWTRIATSYDGSFFGILPLDARTLLAYGLRGHVFRSTDDGATWAGIATPQAVILATALKLKAGTILLAGGTGALLASADNGVTFSPAAQNLSKAVAELVELPDGGVLALGEAGATHLEVGRVVPRAPSDGSRPPPPPR